MSSPNRDQLNFDGAQRPLRVVDVCAFYGEKAGGIRTYIDAKAAWAETEPGIEHTVVIPGLAERSKPGWVELPSVRAVATNGYRVPLGWGGLRAALAELQPDVVIAHDPFWAARGLPQVARELGARSVAIHHGAVGHDARSIPGPFKFWSGVLRREFARVYGEFDAVMAAIDTEREFGITARIPLRFGLDPAFAPQLPADPSPAARGGEVLYAGRMAAAKCVDDLLRAAALSSEPWPLHLVGVGPAKERLARQAKQLGIEGRVTFESFESDRARLAARYRRAAAVVLPGRWETFGLAAYEAAASGGSVVCCTSAGSLATIDGLAETFPPGPHGGPGSDGADERARNLIAAIERARCATPSLQRASNLAASSSWEHALRAELTHLRALAGAAERIPVGS